MPFGTLVHLGHLLCGGRRVLRPSEEQARHPRIPPTGGEGWRMEVPGYSLSGVIASCIFILLTVRQHDDFRVLGPAAPVVARVGEDALLTCRLLPKRSAAQMQVEWYRAQPRTAAPALQDGTDLVEVQTESCRDQVEMVEDSVAEGSVTLKIRDVQPSDSGQYWCRFQDGDYLGETSLLLQVAGLGSAPSIHITRSEEGGVQLVCTAEGWFPEPQVYWEDRWGEKLLTVSEHHVPGEDGLFYVEDTLVLGDVSAATETVSCFLHSPTLKEGKGTVLNLPEKLQTEMASLKVIGPSQPILARVGEDIELTCYLSPETNAQSMEVRWVRSLWYPAVHVYKDGDHMTGEQMSEYRGRTSLVGDAIHEGRLTLQIRDARASDHGQYRCLFAEDGVYQEASLDLKVVAMGSAPLITMETQEDGARQLACTSDGWFPPPQVQWRDMEGRSMPSPPAALRQGNQGLFHVESLLLVTNSSVVKVTCAISNLLLGEEKTAAVALSESKMSFSWKMLLVLGLLLAMTIGLIWMKSYKKVNVTQDSNAAHLKPTLPEEHKYTIHEYPSPRVLTTSCTCWVRKGSHLRDSIESLRSGMR